MATIRAAVDAIIPGMEGRPGAAELDVARHVAEAIELYLPGFVDLLVTLLDAYAVDIRSGAAFTELTHEERGEVLRAMSKEESPDMQDIVDGLQVFTFGGFYSEWTGYERQSRSLIPPQVWDDMGYQGPSLGHPGYREGI